MPAFKFNFKNFTASGNTEIIAAVASKKIRVHQYLISIESASDIFLRDSGGTQLIGTKYLSDKGGAAGDAPRDAFLFETGLGNALEVNSSNTVNGSVDVVYTEEV